MTRIINILLVTLALLCFQQETKAASVPQEEKYNVEILFVPDIEKYVKNNPDVHLLEAFENVKNVGHTIGVKEKGDKELLNFENNVFIYEHFDRSYVGARFPREFEVEKITYVELQFENNVNGGKVFVIGGGIGQNFISLLMETPPQSEGFAIVHIKVYGKTLKN